MEVGAATRQAGHRGELTVRIRKGPLETPGVRVLDLSLAGCMIEWHGWKLQEAQRLLVSFPTLSNVGSTVLWIEDNRVGLLFDDLLHMAVYEHMIAARG